MRPPRREGALFAWATLGWALVWCGDVAQAWRHSPYDRFGWWAALGWVAWVVAALPIALTHMESLWLPWMLCCPALIRMPRGWRWGLAAGLLAGTISVLALQATLQWVGWLAVAVAAWGCLRSSVDAQPGEESAKAAAALRPALAAMLLFPFFAVSVSSTSPRPPPAGLMARRIEAKAYEVHLLGQSPAVEILWFEPQGDGRHHTLAVCMRYRRVELKPAGEAGVMTDGRRWMREMFLQDRRLAADYSTYLRRTFLPLADPGAHIIVIGDASGPSAEAFLTETEKSPNNWPFLRRGERRRTSA